MEAEAGVLEVGLGTREILAGVPRAVVLLAVLGVDQGEEHMAVVILAILLLLGLLAEAVVSAILIQCPLDGVGFMVVITTGHGVEEEEAEAEVEICRNQR